MQWTKQDLKRRLQLSACDHDGFQVHADNSQTLGTKQDKVLKQQAACELRMQRLKGLQSAKAEGTHDNKLPYVDAAAVELQGAK